MSDSEKREVIFRLTSEVSEDAKKTVKEFGDLISSVQSQIDNLSGSSIATVSVAVSAINAQSMAAKASIKEVADGATAIVGAFDNVVQHTMTAIEKCQSDAKNAVISFGSDMNGVAASVIQSADTMSKELETKLSESATKRLNVVHDRLNKELELEQAALDYQVEAAEDAAKKIREARESAGGNVSTSPSGASALTPALTEIEKATTAVVEATSTAIVEAGERVETELTQQLAEATARRNQLLQERADRELKITEEMLAKKQRAVELANELINIAGQAESMMNAGIDISDQFKEEAEAIALEAAELTKEVMAYEEAQTKKAEAESKKRIEIAEREAESKVRNLEKAIEKDRLAKERQAEEDRKRAEDLAERTRAKQEREFDMLTRKARESGKAVVTAFLEMNESGMRFARGLVAIGLIGEDDLGKVRDNLLAMQAVMDITNGGLKTLVQMDEIYRKITESIAAATAARKLFEATGWAVGGGIAGSARGGAMRGLVAGGLEGGVGGVVQRSGSYLAGATGYALAGVGERMIAGAGARVVAGGGAMAVGGATIGAVAGAIFGLTSAILSLREAIKHGIGGGATEGSFVHSVGTSSYNPIASRISELTYGSTRRVLDKETIARQAEEGKRLVAIQQEITEQTQIRIALEHELAASMMEQKLTLMESLTPTERMTDLNNEIVKRRRELDGLKGTVSEDDLRGQSQVLLKEKELIQLLRVRQETEREIFQTKKEAAETDLQASKALLNDASRRADEEERRAASAMERFGLMSDEDRDEVTDIKRRLDRGEALSGDELRKVQGFTRETDKQVTDAANAMARSGGFDELFGNESLREIERLRGVEKALEVQVKQKMDVIVKVEADYNQIARVTAEQVEIVNAVHRERIEAEITKLIERIATLENGLKAKR